MSGPIRPDEVISKKASQLPEEVFTIFNELIAQDWDGDSATIEQSDVVTRLVAAGISSNRIFDEHLLDVEPVYRAAGWVVVYDKPDRGGSGWFKFSKKSDKSE
jgi:hypothetical protein